MMDWVKIQSDILSHRKIKLLRSRPRGNELLLIWMLTIAEAGKCNRGGCLMVTDKIPYTPETLSMQLGFPLARVKHALNAYAELEMIEYRNGTICLKNWRKYQSEDKLAARREKDRIRQQRHRASVKGKHQALPSSDPVSRDSHADMSRDVTQENRVEKNRIKTTTDKIRVLLTATPLENISDRELQGLARRHGRKRLEEAADIAAETWRKTPAEVHNPGGYLQSMCTSLVVPEWYVPRAERTRSPPAKRVIEAEETDADQEEAETVARDALWASLPGDKQEEYLARVSAEQPPGIAYSRLTSLMLAKGLAWDEAHSAGDG
jgi:predicted phage replisome organizer